MPKSLLQTHCIIGVNVAKNQFLTPCFSPLNADGLCACGLLRAVVLMDDHDTLSQCPLPACTEYVTVRARCGGWWWLWRMMIPNEMLCLASLTTMPPAVCASLNFSSTWCLLNPVCYRRALICTYNTMNQHQHHHVLLGQCGHVHGRRLESLSRRPSSVVLGKGCTLVPLLFAVPWSSGPTVPPMRLD